MSWLSDFFSSNVSSVVDSVGNALDKLITSDDERNAAKQKLAEEMNKLKVAQLEAMRNYDKEITARHAADMASDSWLSKNIRPLSLAFLTVSTVILAYLTIFILEPDKVVLVEPWLELLKILLVTIYAFYFGSRGLEKVNTIKEDTKRKIPEARG